MFSPGDIVECVDAHAMPATEYRNRPVPSGLDVGKLYTVTDFILQGSLLPVGRWIYEIDVVRVAEAAHPDSDLYGFDCGFGAYRFRHVYRPDPKLIELLQRAPAPELEPA